MAIDRSKIQKQADAFVASGKTDRAIEEFLKLLEDKPGDLPMMNRIGDLYLNAGKVRDALDMFKRAAQGYERDGFAPKAVAVLKKARRAAPDDGDVASRLAESYRQTSMIKEAIQIHIEMAEQFTKKGLLKRALEEFAQVVELDPKNLKNKIKLADLYNKEGMKDRAAGIYLEVAEALAIDQMHTEANQILDRAKMMTTSPQVFLTQSKLCVIQKDLAGAANHLRDGLAANARNTDLLEALAEVELQAKNPANALKALSEVPQLPEKALALCERALKEAQKLGSADEALKLFQPIGRDFARRGQGEAAARALQNALQNAMTTDAWMQLADIAHQGGNKQERIDALRRAHASAAEQGDEATAEAALSQLKNLGITSEQISASPEAFTFRGAPTAQFTDAGTVPGETTEIDPLRRMQIQQLLRNAEDYLRGRNNDKAMEAYNGILALDPTHRDAINRIADIIRATGKMTAVQVHYVKMAEKLAGLGLKPIAVEMLDKAESLFPGSTRLYRRTLGLLDVAPAPAPAPALEPVAPEAPSLPPDHALPVIGLDEGAAFRQSEPPPTFEAPASSDLDILIGLDSEIRSSTAMEEMQAPAAEAVPLDISALDMGDFGDFPIPLGEPGEPGLLLPSDLPEALAPEAIESVEPAETTAEAEGVPPLPLAPLELGWGELEEFETPAPEAVPEPEIEPLELEPLPFATKAPVPPAGMPIPVAPAVPAVATPAAIDDELASLLSDIDFQLDYGSPEEAKIEIENALRNYPDHPELMQRLEIVKETLEKLGRPDSQSSKISEDSHSFFDLTDVLGDALMDSGEGEEMHDATNVVEKIQSVDELFNAFREGVEEQVKVDDYDTHYNLGIAYKEMMLIEPAMEEFKKAMRDPERTLECCSMLSICEQVQGNTEGAIEWLRQGINAPGFPPEDSIGLHYDLGELLAQQGQSQEATEHFRFVYDLEPDYREVASRLQ